MVLHVPLPYDHGRDSALGVRGPCPRAGGLGGPSPPPGKQGGVGGCKPPTCYRVKVLHGTQPCIPIVVEFKSDVFLGSPCDHQLKFKGLETRIC